MLASKIKEIRNGRVIVKDSKTKDEKTEQGTYKGVHYTITYFPKEHYVHIRSFNNTILVDGKDKQHALDIFKQIVDERERFRYPNGEALKSLDSKTKDETVKTVPYKGFIITLYKNYSPRFGNMYYAKNNIGEPYFNVPRFQTPEEAINWDKKNVDQYVSEQ